MSDLPADPSQAWSQFQSIVADRDEWKARCEAGAKGWDAALAAHREYIAELESELARVQAIADQNADALTRSVLDLKRAMDAFSRPDCECWRDAEETPKV